MTTTYGLISDLHCHSWSAFGERDAEGRNTRLMSIVHELDRCCAAVRAEGGSQVIIAGDVFHVRGSVEPEVFNPVADLMRHWVAEGIQFLIIAGNHDLTSDRSEHLGSAVEMLTTITNVIAYHDPETAAPCRALLPWIKDLNDLKTAALDLKDGILRRGGKLSDWDLILHGGIDGTLSNMPAHGLTADWLADLGFKRVFSGHYHNAKAFGRGVYSIGAPTHHTWGDVDTKAGWWIVSETEVRFCASHAPSFIDITGAEDPDDLPLIVDGHFVRASIGTATNAEVATWRDLLAKAGARGSVIRSIPATTETKRAGVTVKSLSSLVDSVNDYCTEKKLNAEVGKLCQDIMAEVAA